MSNAFRAGYVAIAGRPNVGKSTLLNQLVGANVAITSKRPQTTRVCVRGIYTDEKAQFVFVDTPGFQTQYHSQLNRAMNKRVRQTIDDVDVIVFVVEALRFDERDRDIVRLFPAPTVKSAPVVLAVNKVDRVKAKNRLLPFVRELEVQYPFASIVPISARSRIQLDALLAEIYRLLPEQAALYEADTLTDRDERFLASELIREKIFRRVGEEVPYATHVVIDRFEQQGGLRRIFAGVWVEKQSQRAILIGRAGETMKVIATDARRDMEKLFGGKVHLEVWVKVKKGWSTDSVELQRAGLS